MFSDLVEVELQVLRVVQGVDLGLVGCKCNIDFLQGLDPFGSERVADLFESILRTNWKIDG